MATQAECAKHLGLSERRFIELVDAGTVERAPRGSYDLDAVRVAYIRHLRARAAGRGGGEGQAIKADEEARRVKLQADKLDLEIKEMRDELVPASEIADVLHSAVLIMKTRLGAVPAKAAPLVAGVKSIPAVERVIRDNFEEALAELAKVEVRGPGA
jgi:phage terminase Nu1 subunit (DNA packaging protein)